VFGKSPARDGEDSAAYWRQIVEEAKLLLEVRSSVSLWIYLHTIRYLSSKTLQNENIVLDSKAKLT